MSKKVKVLDNDNANALFNANFAGINLQLSIGKVQLPALPPTFLIHHAAGWHIETTK